MNLTRNDYFQVSGAGRGILSGILYQNNTSLVVGDQSGAVSLYSLNSLKANLKWSAKFNPISHIEVSKSSIFASSGTIVHHIAPGTESISSIDTNVAESIKTFKVKDNEIWTCGKYTYNHYINKQEIDYMILQDTINDMCISSITGDQINNSILGCNDKSIRVIKDKDAVYTCIIPSSPSSLCMHSLKTLVYGTTSGSFGMMDMQREQGVLLWNIQEQNNEVTGIYCYDFLGSGNKDIIISYSDGTLQVVAYHPGTGEVEKLGSTSLNEGVTSLVANNFQGFPEIVVSTYSGKIVGLSDGSKNSSYNLSGNLASEIVELKQKLEQSKKNYSVNFNTEASTTSKVSQKLSLIGEQAAYSLAIESQYPISMLLIQADIPIEILDSEDHEASITTVEEDSQTLITYRYSDSSNTRLQVTFRNSEGQPGVLNVYVVPCLEPKIAQLVLVEIKPLSLHEKVMSLDTSDRPLNTLKITGNYSKNEMHGWVSQTLPDIPPNAKDDIVTLYYTSCVVGTILVITFSSGWSEFRSDSVSTLAIIKESIMKNSSFRKIHLDIGFIEAPDSCEFVIKLIETQITELQELDTKFQLIEALKEIEIQGDLVKFGEEIADILVQADDIKAQYKKYPKKLQFLQGIVSDLYVDYCKFKNKLDFSDRISHLQSILANFDSETLIDFFKQ